MLKAKKEQRLIRQQIKLLTLNQNNKYINALLKKLPKPPLKSKLILEIQQKNAKIIESMKRTTGCIWFEYPKNDISYMGSWYIELLKDIDKLEKFINKNSQVQKTNSSEITTEINKCIDDIKQYGGQIKYQVKDLEESINKKDPYAWIKKRHKYAVNLSQKEQAEVFKEFLKTKKFHLDISEERKDLLACIKTLQTNKKQINKRMLRNTLRKIERKWESKYPIFSSAILNFTTN